MKKFLFSVLAALAILGGCAPSYAASGSGILDKLFVQAGTGATARTYASKAQEAVSVKDFGAVGDGVVNDQPAIQKAIDTGKGVFFPNGVYRVNSFLLSSTVGQRLTGESLQNVYLTTAAGSTHDILRMAGALSEVSGILFRPGAAANICIRVYGPSVTVKGNRFLAAVDGSGTALLLTDQNPLGGTIAGAYTHTIENNHFGATGYVFAMDIDESSVGGITATKFIKNKHLSNAPIRITTGGGNTYFGNLFQSATGTIGTKVGNGIDLGANVYGEMITGNYFERYTNAILTRAALNTYQSFNSTGNHFDNNAAAHGATIYSNYLADDTVALREFKNGWTDLYSSQATRVFNGASGGTVLLTLDEANKAISTNKRYSAVTALNYSANSQTQTPTSEHAIISGAGAARTGCVLGVAGVQDGQRVTLLGVSWAVTLTSTNVRFASGAASAIFGSTAGQVQSMELVYYAAGATWYEINRTIY